MDIFIFSIALNGRFFFRTGEFQGEAEAAPVQAALVAKFPAVEGYTITRERHPSTFTTATLEN